MPYSRLDFSISSALVDHPKIQKCQPLLRSLKKIPGSSLWELAGFKKKKISNRRWGFVMCSTLVLLVPCDISLRITGAWHWTQWHNELQRTHIKMTILGVPRGSRVLKGDGFQEKMNSILIYYNQIQVWRLGLKFYKCFSHIRSLNCSRPPTLLPFYSGFPLQPPPNHLTSRQRWPCSNSSFTAAPR